ncbi:MAG TPA: hypothetical protein VJ302_18540 [Blastocatellia bacterium]|nr:hypothetical protein [Blastocatellia bacterium]
MLIKFMLWLVLLASLAPSGWAQSEKDQKLLVDTIQKATAIQAYVDLCRERAPATDDDNQQAYAAWKERNQWAAIRSWLATNKQFQTMFEQSRQSTLRQLSAKAGIASTCRALPQMMVSPQFDPSIHNGAELDRIADELRGRQAAPPATDAGTKPPVRPPGASIKPGAPRGSNQVERIVTHLQSRLGYKMLVTSQVPHVLFKDGTIYNNLNVSPYDLELKRSRESEPKNWGRWKYVGKEIHIQWNGKSEIERWEEAQWLPTTPAKKTDRLEGDYSSMTAAGSGPVAGTAFDGFTFTADGRFKTGSSAAILAGIHSRSSRSEILSGTYALDGYSIELHFDDGRVERKGFYFSTETFIGIGNRMYLKSEK